MPTNLGGELNDKFVGVGKHELYHRIGNGCGCGVVIMVLVVVLIRHREGTTIIDARYSILVGLVP